MLKTSGRLILSAILLALCAGLCAAAKTAPALLYGWYPAASQRLLAAVGKVTSLFPLSVAELLLYLAILWALYTLIQVFRGKTGILAWLAGLLLGLSAALLVFLAVWGLNYFNPATLADRLGLEVGEYTADQLYDATAFYLERANDLSDDISRDETGQAALGTFSELSQASAQGYAALAGTYDCFTVSTARPKRVLASRLMSWAGITGIYLCLTGEANVNWETPQASLPFTMAHERAHGQAICPENECNFAAYLACEASTQAGNRYSGYYSAFVYCYNALYKVSAARATELWYQMSEGLAADVRASVAHYQQFEGKVQDAAAKMNDTYLKSFSQEAGVQSYGQAADLLIAWYQSGRAK